MEPADQRSPLSVAPLAAEASLQNEKKLPNNALLKREGQQLYFAHFSSPLTIKKGEENDNSIYTFYLCLIISGACFNLKSFSERFVSLGIIFAAIALLILSICLIDSSLKNTSKFLGRLVFIKTMEVRNYPNWDSAIVTTLILYTPILLFCKYFQLGTREMIGVVASYFVFVWNVKNRRSALYKSCYDTYNMYLKEVCAKEGHKKYRIISNSLAIDILDFDLWAHKSFSEFFIFELLSSLDLIFKSKQEHLLPDKFSKCVRIVDQAGTIGVDVKALSILYNQDKMFNENDIKFILNLSFQLRNYYTSDETIDFLV